jgi:hypothetical protein
MVLQYTARLLISHRRKYFDRILILVRDKHSSLLCPIVVAAGKKYFMTLAPNRIHCVSQP